MKKISLTLPWIGRHCFVPCILIANSLLFSCKGKDGATGPSGKDGTSTVTSTGSGRKSGYIRGTFTDNTLYVGQKKLDIDLEYGNDITGMAVYSDTSVQVRVTKFDSTGDNNMSFTLEMKSLSDLSGTKLYTCMSDGYYLMDDDRYLSYYATASTGTVSGLTYDPVSKVMSGSLSFSYPKGPQTNGATFIGTFSTVLAEGVE